MGPRVLPAVWLAVSLAVALAILALAPLTISALAAMSDQPHSCGGG